MGLFSSVSRVCEKKFWFFVWLPLQYYMGDDSGDYFMNKWLILLLLSITSLACNAAPPPPASEVFQLTVNAVDPNTFTLIWQIKPGYFLYRDSVKLTTDTTNTVKLGTLHLPLPITKTDKSGQVFQVYRRQLMLPISVLGEEAGESLLNLQYQGCSDEGFCYPPEKHQIKLTINNKLALAGVNIEAPGDNTALKLADTAVNQDSIEQVFLQHSWLTIVLSFFSFGLLLSFTPCVLPMIPVLSGIIVGHGENLTTRKAFLLSLSYVGGMSLTYAVVGAVVALLGSNLQIAMQSPFAIGAFSLLFILLALSMFGFFDLKLPVSWQARLAKISRRQANGHYLGAGFMGCLSTLILSPCVTAPLLGALGYIAHYGNVTMGTLALFFCGLGMGTPLLLIGTSAGKLLPKAGAWMNKVKAFFGIMLLAVAIFLLSRIIPAPLAMVLWAALLVFSGIYFGALTPASDTIDKLSQGMGILLLVYGLLVLIGASIGETNPLQPLAKLHLRSSATPSRYAVVKIPIKTVAQAQEALHAAQGKPIMLDFYADWCTSCKIMEATTFQDPAVMKALQYFVILKVDVTANKALLQKFGVIAPPTFVFFTPQGQELKNHRLVGEMSAPIFLKQIERITLAMNDTRSMDVKKQPVPPIITGLNEQKAIDIDRHDTV